MTGKRTMIALAAVVGVVATGMTIAGEADLNDPRVRKYVVGEKYTGYIVNEKESRDIQDDDFQNPAFLWIEKAQPLWSKPEGEAGKSCKDCHGAVESMKGKTTRYPIVHPRTGKLVSVEHQINVCRTEHMKAPAWKWEQDEMLGISGLVRMQSRGLPVNVKVDGPAKPFFEKGKAFYNERRGQFDLACAHCHIDHPGQKVRSELLSQGMPNGFPTYRLKWQKFGSLHRRLGGCNEEIRAEPFTSGGEEYTNLELFIMWRANGLPVETPSVRK